MTRIGKEAAMLANAAVGLLVRRKEHDMWTIEVGSFNSLNRRGLLRDSHWATFALIG